MKIHTQLLLGKHNKTTQTKPKTSTTAAQCQKNNDLRLSLQGMLVWVLIL